MSKRSCCFLGFVLITSLATFSATTCTWTRLAVQCPSSPSDWEAFFVLESMIPQKSSLWLHAPVQLPRAEWALEQHQEAGSGEAKVSQEQSKYLRRGVWGHLWSCHLLFCGCSGRVCSWTWVTAEFISLVPSGLGTWLALLVSWLSV